MTGQILNEVNTKAVLSRNTVHQNMFQKVYKTTIFVLGILRKETGWFFRCKKMYRIFR